MKNPRLNALKTLTVASLCIVMCVLGLKCGDTTPPEVSVTNPTDGETVFGFVTVTVTASDDDSLAEVALLIDNSEVLTFSEEPYEYEWNTLEYEDGTTHTIMATAVDASGNEAESEVITVTVDQPSNPPNNPTEPPTGPGAGLINVSLEFSASATDPDGDSVSIQFDWGDGTRSDWSSFVASGESVTMEKSFTDTGTYEVKFKAKDIFEVPSDWSPELDVLISETPSYGHIQVNSTPSGADIFLNDSSTGLTTNTLISDLLPGNYKITLQLEGYADLDTTITVAAEQTATLDATLEEIGTLVWSYETGGAINSSPAIASDGTLYFGSGDNFLYALNSSTGAVIWSYETEVLAVNSSPAVGPDGIVYFGSEEEYLYALRPDGGLRWRYKADGAIACSPALDAELNIYFGTTDGYLYKVDSTGDRLWRYQVGDNVASSPALTSDGTVYFGSDDGYIYALNPDGTLKWQYDTGNWVISSPAIGSDGTVYCGSNSNYLYALDPTDGSLVWQYETDGYVQSSPVLCADGTIYFGSDDEYLYALNSDGSLKWKYKTDHRIRTTPAVGADGTVYVGSFDASIHAVRSDGTLKWKYDTGGLISTGAALGSDGTLYIGSNDNIFYAIKTDSYGLASSPWPKFCHDNRNTSRFGGP